MGAQVDALAPEVDRTRHAADAVVGFVHRHLGAAAPELERGRHAGWSGANHSDSHASLVLSLVAAS